MEKVFKISLLLYLTFIISCKKPEYVQIKQLPDANKVKEVSVWEADSVNGYEILNPHKLNSTSDINIITEIRKILAELDRGEFYTSGGFNLICFETNKKISCIDVIIAEPLYGAQFQDANGLLERALVKSGLVPKRQR